MVSIRDVQEKCQDFQSKYEQHQQDPAAYQPLQDSRLMPISGLLNRNADQVACEAGCNYCCFYRVTAFTHEVVAIYSHIHSQFTGEQLAAVKGRIFENADKIRKMTEEEHLRTNMECSFLQEGRCSIYSVRPVACAACYSTSKDVCKYLHENPTDLKTSLPTIKSLTAEVSLEKIVVYTTLKQMGHDNNRYELNTSLMELFNNPSLIEKWRLDGQKIFGQP
jgi:Fe-S-cluster containining protein